LSDNKNHLLEDLLSPYQIRESDFSEEQKNAKNILEIGFGFGDFLFEKAKQNSNQNFFGFEPHINGVVNLLAKLQQEPLKNLKISTQDVRLILSEKAQEFFDEVYILFPDPWPKSKHFKRRLINKDFLDFLASKMKPNSNLIIATDHDSYKTWILSAIVQNNNFNWLAESKSDWQNFPSWWTETKYQKKAALEGRISVIFKLQKCLS
ncbi:MAG: tRNA (guanosine(46)-N7)-methyltransferase TrmB, partial [Pelagibacterales bacterium]|nr:tRNA (guanosine(46)-N7)-methyltransferase TrmB [Pelagibacterales bacterium]